MEELNANEIRKGCARQAVGHGLRTPKQMLTELLEEVGEDERPDGYGNGAIIRDFEAHIASLLGKESAVFMPSGTMAQQISLRIWCDRAEVPRAGYHPSSHLHLHEQQALSALHRLEVVLLGSAEQPFMAVDIEAVEGELGAVLIELPQREIGGVLLEWHELEALVAAARSKASAVHLDGARLWEAAPFYDRSVADISALFDSVYVSFYKGIGGIAGAVLAGSAEHIDAARIWQRRHGGNLVSMWPYVISARRCLAARLEKMPAYVARMRAFADAVRGLEGLKLTPDPPHTNMVHMRLAGDPEALTRASIEVSRDSGIWVGHKYREGGKLEMRVGDASLEVDPEEFGVLYGDILARAREISAVE